MRSLGIEGRTWERYEDLRRQNRRLHTSLWQMLKEMLRGNPATGLGKPEPLQHALSGLGSRRLSRNDRLLYSFDDTRVYSFAIGGHYDQ